MSQVSAKTQVTSSKLEAEIQSEIGTPTALSAA